MAASSSTAAKKQHIEKYIQQQQMVVYGPGESSVDGISMEDFKAYIKRWFELDNYLKKAQEVLKEKRKEKLKISEVIMKFMCKHDIEDLNTKEGRIRCKSAYVKPPVSKNLVQQRLSDYFANDEDKKKEVIQRIYNDGEKVERVTLRRLKIT